MLRCRCIVCAGVSTGGDIRLTQTVSVVVCMLRRHNRYMDGSASG
jgi:hypothetical protein